MVVAVLLDNAEHAHGGRDTTGMPVDIGPLRYPRSHCCRGLPAGCRSRRRVAGPPCRFVPGVPFRTGLLRSLGRPSSAKCGVRGFNHPDDERQNRHAGHQRRAHSRASPTIPSRHNRYVSCKCANERRKMKPRGEIARMSKTAAERGIALFVPRQHASGGAAGSVTAPKSSRHRVGRRSRGEGSQKNRNPPMRA